jgi:hypothetical protein
VLYRVHPELIPPPNDGRRRVSRPVRPHRPRPRPRHERRSLPGLPRSVRGRVSLQVGPTTPRVLSRRHRAVPVASSTLVAVPFQPPGELVRAHAMRRSIVGNFGHGATSAYHTAMPGPWSRRSQVGTTATTVIRRTISRWYQPRRFARPPFGSDFFRPQPQQSVRPCTLDPQDPAVRRLYVPASVLTMPRLTWFHVSTMSYLPVVQRTRTSPSAGSCSTPRPRLPATTEEANDPPAGPSGPPSRHLFSLTLHRNTPVRGALFRHRRCFRTFPRRDDDTERTERSSRPRSAPAPGPPDGRSRSTKRSVRRHSVPTSAIEYAHYTTDYGGWICQPTESIHVREKCP